LNTQYFELLKKKIETGLQSTSSNQNENSETNSHSNQNGSKPLNKNLTLKDVQEKVKSFLVNARIFEKSMKLFASDTKIHDLLSKHLIKTVSSEIVNEMLRILAEEQMIQVANEENLNTEVKKKTYFMLKDDEFDLFLINYQQKKVTR
jgi:hypothetical protein